MLPSAIVVRGLTRATRRVRVPGVAATEVDVRVLTGVRGNSARDDAGGGGAEVDEHLRAERLGEGADDLHATIRWSARLEARILEVLGPDPEHDGSADVVAQHRVVSRKPIVDGQAMVAEGDGEAPVTLLQLRLDQIDRGRPDEAGDELVDRPVVERLRSVDLLQAPAVHHRDAVAHRHRLDLVVRDVDRRHIEPPLQLMDLGAHLHPQLRVEVRERLVHQEGLRLADDRATHCDALTLAARESARLALEEVLDLEDARRALDPLLDFLLRQLVELEAEGEVLLDGHVRIERVALEHHRDVALLRRQVVDDAVADPDLAVGDLLEARNHAQGGRLAAAGGADENHQLTILDGETEVEDGLRAVVVDLLNVAELDLGHSRRQLTPVCGRRQRPGQ